MLCGLLLLLLLLQLLLLLLLLANGPFELVGTPLELRDGVRPSEMRRTVLESSKISGSCKYISKEVESSPEEHYEYSIIMSSRKQKNN